MSNDLFAIVFPTAGAAVVLALLWGPTIIVVAWMRQHTKAQRSLSIMLSVGAEFCIAAGLALLADQIGFRNPAGYVLAIAVFVGLIGAATVWLHAKHTANSSLDTADQGRRST